MKITDITKANKETLIKHIIELKKENGELKNIIREEENVNKENKKLIKQLNDNNNTKLYLEL